MNTPSNAVPGSPIDSQGIAPAAMSETRPMYWSVRRELWENRSIYIAPLAVAAVVLFGFLISTIGLPHRRRAVLLLNPTQQRAAIGQQYDMAAVMILATAFIVGVFYCLDALHGERRDRSILFWKSLPVSDLTTVLSKASIPLVVLPLIVFAIVVATQVDMLLMSNAVLRMNGVAATTGEQFPFFQQSLILLYGLIALALWHAPIYGWLLLVSSWARRATFLWAVLPFTTISVLEKIAFNTSYFGSMVKFRLIGHVHRAFAFDASGDLHDKVHSLTQLTPERFLSTPGLWVGLLFAAGFLAAAVRLRRDRGPI
jgi:ABC-2 type transport system permease protein